MKKKLCAVLAVLFAFSLFSCDTNPAYNVGESAETAAPETEPMETAAPETQPPVVEIDYKTIECTKITEWKDIGIRWNGSDSVMVSKFPSDWELAPLAGEEDTTMVILRDGADIGLVSTLVPQTSLETLESTSYTGGEIELDYDVRKVKEGKGYTFRRVFGFFVDDYRVFFEIDYNEIDDAGCVYMSKNFDMGAVNGEAFRVPAEGGNSSRRVLVIGNSFIRTSEIGSYLEDFQRHGKKYYRIETFTRNGQSVEDYAKESWLKEYRNGTYHVLFLCGLYNLKDVDNFPKVLEACKASDTKLVIFPAHNERYGRVELVLEKYPDVMYLSWRDEINYFIDNGGISYWDFCYNDGDKHSKPIAGYIGAHMVYTALYGEVPPEYKLSAPHSMSYIKSMLGEDYVKTGIAPGERVYKTYELTD